MKKMPMQGMIRRGVSDQTPKAPIRIIGATIKEAKVRTMVTTIKRVNMLGMGTTTTIINSTRINIVTRIIELGHILPLKIGKLLLGTVEVVWRELRICYKRL